MSKIKFGRLLVKFSCSVNPASYSTTKCLTRQRTKVNPRIQFFKMIAFSLLYNSLVSNLIPLIDFFPRNK